MVYFFHIFYQNHWLRKLIAKYNIFFEFLQNLVSDLNARDNSLQTSVILHSFIVKLEMNIVQAVYFVEILKRFFSTKTTTSIICLCGDCKTIEKSGKWRIFLNIFNWVILLKAQITKLFELGFMLA